jgi:hypothetical protein
MDFLDPKKQKAHRIRLAIGYALLGVALLLGTVVLLYQAYGFGIDSQGRVIQNGLVFFSSNPGNANIYIDGQLKDTTNTRIQLPGGAYTVELRKDGYRSWKRAITVEGGVVERFDYPFLFPTKLTPGTVKQYTAAPTLYTQSPDRRWLLLQSGAQEQFDMYDLAADKPLAKPLGVPTEALLSGTLTTGWEAVEWAPDNRHVVLRRTYQKDGQPGMQYVLFDRENPAGSQNLSILFGFTPSRVTLRDGHYDQYYLFDQTNAQLFTATLKKPTPQPYLSDVLSYGTKGDRLAYVTATGAPANKVLVRLRHGDRTFTVRQLSAVQARYLVEIGRYNGDWFVAVGAQAESKVYIYKNPDGVLDDDPGAVLVPIHILKTESPTHVSFSINNRFVMSENNDRFAVYDTDIDKGYAFQTGKQLDSPQLHAVWLDGSHLEAVSGGKLLVLDYDGANLLTLGAAAPAYVPFFTPDYQKLYTLNPQNALTSTSLLVE